MIKAIFFDFDGVLTTLPNGTFTVCNYFAQKTGKAFDDLRKAYLLDVGPRNLGQVEHAQGWKSFWLEAGLTEDLKALDEAFLSAAREEKMFELVSALKTHGYQTGIITDNTKRRMELLESEWKLNEAFDSIIVSSRLGVDKFTGGDKIFKIALNSLNLKPEEAIFVDNSEKNIQTAQSLGMAGIYYDSESRDVERLTNELRMLSIKL